MIQIEYVDEYKVSLKLGVSADCERHMSSHPGCLYVSHLTLASGLGNIIPSPLLNSLEFD